MSLRMLSSTSVPTLILVGVVFVIKLHIGRYVHIQLVSLGLESSLEMGENLHK